MKRATIQKGKIGYSFTKLQQKAKDLVAQIKRSL